LSLTYQNTSYLNFIITISLVVAAINMSSSLSLFEEVDVVAAVVVVDVVVVVDDVG
jgi:hypothetical protein